MSFEDLGNLGEFVGAIAVVVTLGYLAVQIRQNSRLLRATISQTAAQSALEFNTALVSDRELLRVFTAGRRDLSDLNAEDRDAFTTILIALFYSYEAGFYHHQDGVLHLEMWEGRQEMLRRLLQEEGTGEWWEKSKWIFGAQFREFVDRLRTA